MDMQSALQQRRLRAEFPCTQLSIWIQRDRMRGTLDFAVTVSGVR